MIIIINNENLQSKCQCFKKMKTMVSVLGNELRKQPKKNDQKRKNAVVYTRRKIP